ncbi:MAG: hypothetical protein JWP46_332 [Modestobacter sp.]|nr:hypothetical protein [Modestobacter sp.]
MRSPLATLRSLVRRYERELVCGRCRAVLAWVRLRPVALMHVRDTTGAEVTPLGCRTALGIAERRLGQARAAGAAGRPQALDEYDGIAACEREMAYLRREAGEVMYEFRCRACRARYVRSLPDLAAAVRRAGGSRVELR